MKTENSKESIEVCRLSNLFAQKEGRRPRIMIATPKSSTLKSDAQLVASNYADLGFDVDIAPPFEKAKDLIKQAIESDIHVLSISLYNSHDWLPAFIKEFLNYDTIEFKLVLRGHISKQDYTTLLKMNSTTIFQKNKMANEIAREILECLHAI